MRRAGTSCASTAGIAVSALALGMGACGEPREVGPAALAPPDTAAMSMLVAEQFGEGFDPADVVARTGGVEVTVGDVATYRSVFPTLTVRQAMEDLIDLRLASRAAEGSGFEWAERFGQDRGLVLGWLRERVWSDALLSTPNPSTVQSWLDDPARSELWGRPELVRASHILFLLPPEAPEDVVQRAQAEAERVATELRSLHEPAQLSDLEALAVGAAPRFEGSVASVRVEPHLLFPRVYSGPERWGGVEQVVPEFAEPAFAARPGEIVGPVRTIFGWHVVLVETRIPDTFPGESERRRITEEAVVAEQRADALREVMHRLTDETEIVTHEENMHLLSLTAEERLRSQSERTGIGLGGP